MATTIYTLKGFHPQTQTLKAPCIYALLTKREVKMAGYWLDIGYFLRSYGPGRTS